MGDLGRTSQVARLQRQLEGAAALIARCVGWLVRALFLLMCATTIGVFIPMFALCGTVLIGAGMVQAWTFFDDAVPGLRTVQMVGAAVFLGSGGIALLGFATCFLVYLLRVGLAYEASE